MNLSPVKMIRVLIVDNYDSFTYNLLHLLQKIKPCCHYSLLRHHDKALFHEDYSRLVISPGPMGPKDTGLLKSLFDQVIVPKAIPCLGICLGMQFIGWYFGHRVVASSNPVHGLVDVIQHKGQGLFKGIPRDFDGARYNSLEVLDREDSELEVLARNSDGRIMALHHQVLPFAGVQFHPESFLTEFSVEIIKNWFDDYV